MRNVIMIIILTVVLDSFVLGQEKGVKFEQLKNWDDILAKARTENKDIFVDCYTTWCGYCKKMDKEVYVDSAVGSYLNQRYISVRVQIDSTAYDNQIVKNWYNTAKKFKESYGFSGFPSYLFFSSKGNLLHRGTGFKNSFDFIKLVSNAQDTTKQYTTLIREFKKGQFKLEDLPELVHQANLNGDKELGKEIGNYYKIHYLDTLSDKALLAPQNLNFYFSNFDLVNSSDRFFYLCFHRPDLFGSTSTDMIKNFVDNVIIKEEITNRLWMHDSIITLYPDWKVIYKSIENKYGQAYADDLLPGRKRLFYYQTHNWDAYSSVVEEQIGKYSYRRMDTSYLWSLNNYAWAVFLSCNDKEVLSKALQWCEKSIESMGDNYSDVHNFYDTRANIRYKLGMIQEAIVDEEKAIHLSKRFHSDMINAYEETINKMKNGKPTWE